VGFSEQIVNKRMWVQKNSTVLILAGIFLLAAIFRLWHLSTLPPGLHPDEAANGLDIFRMFDHHDLRPLYDTNGPREALFFYLQAIFVGTIGNTVLALRLAPALLGTLAIVFMYLWARAWFGQRTALIAAFLLAITPWAVTITRDGFRASMLELFVPLVLWLYTKAFQTGRLRWFLGAGFFLGLGMYTYLAWRLFPLALVAAALYVLIWRRDFARRWWHLAAWSLVGFVIALVPMGLYGIHHFDELSARSGGVSFLNKDLNHGHPLQTLADNTLKTALMFNLHGDENYRQNLGGQPELNIFVGIMFILGILLALSRLKDLRYFALLAVFVVMLLPEALTAEGIPHALRAIGALDATLVLAAVGISYLIDQWYGVFPANQVARSTGLAAILVLLGLSAYQGYAQYYIAWAHSPQTYAAYSHDMAEIGYYLNARSFAGRRFAVVDGYSDKTVQYLTHYHEQSDYTRLDPQDIAAATKAPGAKEFVIGEEFKNQAIPILRAKFPKGQLSPHYSGAVNYDKELFTVYTVSQ
jgi:4-amino-4-deoxy-L-arabinose transferase-like glycosyltransferase